MNSFTCRASRQGSGWDRTVVSSHRTGSPAGQAGRGRGGAAASSLSDRTASLAGQAGRGRGVIQARAALASASGLRGISLIEKPPSGSCGVIMSYRTAILALLVSFGVVQAAEKAELRLLTGSPLSGDL